MVRELKELVVGDVGNGGSAVLLILWGVLVTFFLLSAIIFFCAEGASKDKESVDTATVYGGGCGAGCGAACGA